MGSQEEAAVYRNFILFLLKELSWLLAGLMPGEAVVVVGLLDPVMVDEDAAAVTV